MTKLTTLLCILPILWAYPTFAQLPVSDAARQTQAQVQHEQMMDEIRVMQRRQDQQITILTQQLARLTFVSQVLGDPLTNTALAGGEPILECLTKPGVDRARSDILAMTEDALSVIQGAINIYRSVNETFKTLDGQTEHRDASAYRVFAAITGATVNHDTVAVNVKERHERLRAAMAETVQKMSRANTSTEIQKLQAILSAQHADIAAADNELGFATDTALIQDIENRNDQEKQAVARREEQAAEMSATMNRLRE